jgi:DNA-binding response OmpR family regulator
MNKTILLIDDDEVETGLLYRLLARSGFEVLVCNNSLECIQMVREYDPGIVILDLMMPEMSGWEVCKEIRQFSYVHILIFSAVSESTLVAKAIFAGADYYLAKPTPVAVLVEYLNSVVNSRSGEMIAMPVPSMLQSV